jgi:acyl-coenzyme A synthetase/AMP-(fatty) acid ligase
MLTSRPSSLKHDEIPHLRFLTSSSAPLLVEDWKRFEGLYGIPISQGYGASECGWIAGSNEKNRRLGSVGRPLNYQNVVISDQAGNNLPANVQGMVVIGHTDTQNSYFGDDAEIRTDSLGRIVTGDIGYIDEDGFLFLTGREKDLIIIGGINVSPIEIENVIMELTEIVEAAVIGIKEQIYGEEIIAFVVPVADAGLSSDEVLAHCRQKLARVKIPRSIEFVNSLPKTERGKLDRKGLKKTWSDSKND